MHKDKSIKKNYQFKRILQKGRSSSAELVKVSYQLNRTGNNKIGIALRKNAKSSVLRSRIKRIIREIYRLNSNKLKSNLDIIILVNNPLDDFKLMKDNIEKCFEKLDIYKQT